MNNNFKFSIAALLLSIGASCVTSLNKKANQSSTKTQKAQTSQTSESTVPTMTITREEKKPKLLEQAESIYTIVNYHRRAFLKGEEPVLRSTSRYADLKFCLIDGAICLAEEKYDLAVKCFKLALIEAEKIGEKGARGALYYLLARAHQDNGEAKQAMDYFERAIKFDEAIGHISILPFVFFKKGLFNKQLGNNEEAIADLEKALSLLKIDSNLDAYLASTICDSLSAIYSSIGKENEAMKYMARATQEQKKISAPEGLVVKPELNY